MMRVVGLSLCLVCMGALLADLAHARRPRMDAPNVDAKVITATEKACLVCHDKGKVKNAPSLRGLQDWYVLTQLNVFKRRLRGTLDTNPDEKVMLANLPNLTNAEQRALIAKLINKPVIDHPDTVEGDATRGEALYKAQCITCHGPKGEGRNFLKGPKLTGFEDWYVKKQLEMYRDGLRGYHEKDKLGKQMSDRALNLTDQQINDLTVYIRKLAKIHVLKTIPAQ